MKFERIKLGYAYESLEPYIDAATMKIHYESHHKTYETKFLEKFVGSVYEKQYQTLEDFYTNIDKVTDQSVKQVFLNMGGGLLNHNIYFEQFKIGTNLDEKSNVGKAIIAKYKSINDFKAKFKEASLSLFGSGWVWLVRKGDDIELVKTSNQDNPLKDGSFPILGIDLWEHAYYLKHQSARGNHFEDFWMVIDWNVVNGRFTNNKF